MTDERASWLPYIGTLHVTTCFQCHAFPKAEAAVMPLDSVSFFGVINNLDQSQLPGKACHSLLGIVDVQYFISYFAL